MLDWPILRAQLPSALDSQGPSHLAPGPVLGTVLGPASGLLAALLGLSGCPQPLIARPYAAPTPQVLLQRVLKQRDLVQSLRGRAKADYLAERGERVKVDISVVASRPASLRLAGESTFTGPLLTLATDGEDFQLLDVQRNRFMGGRVNPCNMARLIRVALHPREALDVLLGGAPLLGDAERVEVAWDGHDGGREVLTMTDPRRYALSVRLDAAQQHWDVREAELRDPRGQVLWRVRHEGFQALGPDGEPRKEGAPGDAAADAPRLPSVTYIEDPPNKADVRLRWREREVNPALEGGLFKLAAPPGVPTEPDVCQEPGAGLGQGLGQGDAAAPAPAPTPAAPAAGAAPGQTP